MTSYKEHLLLLITTALAEHKKFFASSNSRWSSSEDDVQNVLSHLQNTVTENGQLTERLLRAFIDISVFSQRNYEGTEVNRIISQLFEEFYTGIPEFRSMKPLGMDFGKGVPF